MKFKNEEKIKKLNWESDMEYKYRIETGRIIAVTGQILTQIGVIAKTPNKMFGGVTSQLKIQRNKLNNLFTPERYTIVQEFLVNCLNAYTKAGNLLEEGMKNNDSQSTYKSGRYIQEGNCWMELSKIRIWEAIEKAIKEENNKILTPTSLQKVKEQKG